MIGLGDGFATDGAESDNDNGTGTGAGTRTGTGSAGITGSQTLGTASWFCIGADLGDGDISWFSMIDLDGEKL